MEMLILCYTYKDVWNNITKIDWFNMVYLDVAKQN